MTVGYTIFNKEKLIPKIVFGLNEAFDSNDEFIFLFDNCTDGSLDAFLKLKHYLPSEPELIIAEEDLYEVKANNRILSKASQDIIILFQDDVVNHDLKIKEKISTIVDKYGDNLGLLGGRSGYELSGDTTFPERDYHRVSNWEHKDKQFGYRLKEGEYKERTFLNRSPIVFTRKLLQTVGYLDEAFYPLWGDDLDYCARAKFSYDKKNIVFQCNVESQLKWGTLHSGESKVNLKKVMRRNWGLFMSRWSEILKQNYENIIIQQH